MTVIVSLMTAWSIEKKFKQALANYYSNFSGQKKKKNENLLQICRQVQSPGHLYDTIKLWPRGLRATEIAKNEESYVRTFVRSWTEIVSAIDRSLSIMQCRERLGLMTGDRLVPFLR